MNVILQGEIELNFNSKDISVFIINLKHSVERKKHMQELCEKYNLNYEFIDAVDGKALTEDEVVNIYSKEKVIQAIGREMSRGEIGVLLSQKSIYQKMIDEDIELAMIFEDDVEFDDELMTIIKNMDSFPTYWNLVLLGHHACKSRNIETGYSFWGQSRVTNKYKLARPYEMGCGAYGYLLKKSAAKVLLDELNVIDRPIDHLTGSDEKLNLYVLIPTVIDIHQDLSDNHHNMEDRKKLQEKFKQESQKKQKSVIYSKKRKLLIFLHLDKIWDSMNEKYIRLKQFLKKRRKYE